MSQKLVHEPPHEEEECCLPLEMEDVPSLIGEGKKHSISGVRHLIWWLKNKVPVKVTLNSTNSS